MTMTKSELIHRLADMHPELPAGDMERVVNAVFGGISNALSQGERIELRGFGAFSVRERDAKTGRNPRTGESVQVPSKRVPFFKCGKELRERINR